MIQKQILQMKVKMMPKFLLDKMVDHLLAEEEYDRNCEDVLEWLSTQTTMDFKAWREFRDWNNEQIEMNENE